VKVTIDPSLIFFSLSPTTLEEYDVLTDIANSLQIGDELEYLGPRRAVPALIRPFFVHPALWIKESPPYKTELKLGFRGKEFKVTATSDEDEINLWRIVFPFVFLKVGAVLGGVYKKHRAISVDFFMNAGCKKCGIPSVDARALMYICEECAAKCAHKYKLYMTFIHLPGEDKYRLGVAEFCEYCRRKNPDFNETKYTMEEHKRLVNEEFGLKVAYTSDFLK
jgi:hypothetical protein